MASTYDGRPQRPDRRPDRRRDDQDGPRPSRGTGGIPDGAIIGLLGTLLGATALVWLSTALSALMTHGRLPHPLPFGGTPEAIRSLALRPNHLAAAWPGTPAADLPSPLAFWVAFFLLLALLISLTLTILTAWLRIRAARDAGRFDAHVKRGPQTGKAKGADGPDGALPPEFTPVAPGAHSAHSAHGEPVAPGAPMVPVAPGPYGAPVAHMAPSAHGVPVTPGAHGLPGAPAAPGETTLDFGAVAAPAPPARAFAFPAGMTALLVPDAAGIAAKRLLLQRAVQTATGPVLVVTDDLALWESRPPHRDARLFDPLRLVDEVPDPDTRVRWAPHHRCEDQATATGRAHALLAPTARTGTSPLPSQTERAVQETAQTLLRCWLHAAALDGRPFRHVQRWAGGHARNEAAAILRTADPHQAAAGWDGELQAVLTPTTAHAAEVRETALARILSALDALSELQVLQACTPSSTTDGLDVESVLRHRGTLYLLGRATEGRVDGRSQRSAMPLLTALVEDVVERGRRMAVRSSSGRLDPPLLCVLDNVAAVAPFPGLPELMARGGPLGLTGVAVLRSPEQARSRWDARAVHSLWTNSDARAVVGPIAGPELTGMLTALDTAPPEVGAASAGRGGGALAGDEIVLLTSRVPAQRFRTAVPSGLHPAQQ